MKAPWKRLIIWRSQVQALAGPLKVQEKSWTFFVSEPLDFKELTDLYINLILIKSYSCSFPELLIISALFYNWFTRVYPKFTRGLPQNKKNCYADNQSKMDRIRKKR